jgi:hypothetical protein
VPLVTILRQEDHTDAVLAFLGELDVEAFGMMTEKLVRHLHQNARAIAGIILASARASMVEIHEHLKRVIDELMGLFTTEMNDKTDTACIVFKSWIVETLFFWEAWSIHSARLLNEIV